MIQSTEVENERKHHAVLTEQMGAMAALLKETTLQMNAEVMRQNKVKGAHKYFASHFKNLW